MVACATEFDTLEMLHDLETRAGRYVRAARESIRQGPGVLIRQVALEVRVPAADPPPGFGRPPAERGTHRRDEFILVLRAARRGEIWPITNLSISQREHSLLTHEEHVQTATSLIRLRLCSALAPWLEHNTRDHVQVLKTLDESLTEVPLLPEEEAKARIAE